MTKSLMTFVTGFLLCFYSSIAISSEFSCPVPSAKASLTCSGSVKVKTMAELNSYVNTLGVNPKKPKLAKSLIIDFNPDVVGDLVVSTPCSINIKKGVVFISTGNLCLHGEAKVNVESDFKFTGKNLILEGKSEVFINTNSDLKGVQLKLLSLGVSETSRAYIKESAHIEAESLFIESFDRGFIGKNSSVKLTGNYGQYVLGDDEAALGQGTKIEAARIEIASTKKMRLGNLVSLAADEVILNGVDCVVNKTAIITATDKMGNCFLKSSTKASFTIDKNQGSAPFIVNFKAGAIAGALGYVWTFGDGESVSTTNLAVAHTYTKVGSFTAILKYATKANFKGLKSAGSLQIDVKEGPIVALTPPSAKFYYQQVNEDTIVYLRSFIEKTQSDIKSAYYVIDEDFENIINVTHLYANAPTVVDMHTLGEHKVTLYVEDVKGQKFNTTMTMNLTEYDDETLPVIIVHAKQSAARSIFLDMSDTFIPFNEQLIKDFKIDFGDGQGAFVQNAATYVHKYSLPGTYTVRVTAEYNGNEASKNISVTVTDAVTAAINPVVNFTSITLGFAGHVNFVDERSGTANGEIISYAWDFGDGVVAYGKSLAHFYLPGEYLVKLTVTDTAGMRASQTQKVNITETGDELVTYLECREEDEKEARCEMAGLDKFEEIVRMKVEWGDGDNEIITTPDLEAVGYSIRYHEYEEYGTYDVKFSVETSRGESKSRIQKIAFIDNTPAPIVGSVKCDTYGGGAIGCYPQNTYDPSGGALVFEFDYGDGFIDTNNVNWFSQHTYTSEGLFTVAMKVINSQGKYTIVNTQVNIIKNYLSASIQCNTSNLFVYCNAVVSHNSAQGPLSFSFDFGDSFLDNNERGNSSHSYTGVGTYIVKLKVVNSLGEVALSEKQVQTTLPINQPPLAKAGCLVQGSKISCNSIASMDIDGYIISSSWNFGDGTTAEGTFVEHEYSSYGQYEVVLIVRDNLFLESLDTQTIPIAGVSPVVIASCDLRFQTLYCDASKSFDVDDKIAGYEWKINEEKVGNGEKLKYKITAEGNKSVELKIKDERGNYTIAQINNYEIVNEFPNARFGCDTLNQQHLKCSAEVSTDDGNIESFEWTFNGHKYFSKIVDFEVTEDQTYHVALKITDNMGISSTKEIDYEMKPSIEIEKSKGSIELEEKNKFYPLIGEIGFLIKNVNLREDTSLNSVFLNDLELDKKLYKYDFENNSITITSDLVDGQNNVKMTVFDSQNKSLTAEHNIWAGSRIINANIEKEDSGIVNGEVELRFIFAGQVSTEIKITESGGKFQLINVPSANFFVRASQGKIAGSDFLYDNDEDLLVKMHDFPIEEASSLSFSNGIGNWNVGNSNYEITPDGLNLKPDSNGVIQLRNKIKSKNANTYIALPFKISSSSKDVFVSAVLRNEKTGQITEHFYSGDDILDPNNNGSIEQVTDYEEGSSFSGKDEFLEVELKAFLHEPVITSRLEKTINSIISSLWASGSNDTSIITRGVVAATYGPATLKNVQGTSLAFDLGRFISLGVFPTYYLENLNVKNDTTIPFPILIEGRLQPSNPLSFEIPYFGDLSLDSIKNISLLVFNTENERRLLEEFSRSRAWELSNGKIKGVVEITSSNRVSGLDYLYVELQVELITGEKTRVKIGRGQKFQNLVSLTAYNSFLDGTKRFSNRDLSKGGDDYVKLSLVQDVVRMMESFGDVKTIEEKKVENDKNKIEGQYPAPDNLDLNDASLMNGGNFTPHFSHKIGQSLDLKFDDYLSPGNIISKNDVIIAKKILNIMTSQSIFEEHILNALVRYDADSNFEKYLKLTCMPNGYLGNEMIVSDSEHYDHFHFNMSNERRRNLGSKEMRICTRLSPAGDFLEIRSCQFADSKMPTLPIVDNELYTVGAKSIDDPSDYKFLDYVDGKFNLPDELRNKILKVKVIDRGERGVKGLLRFENRRRIGCSQQFVYVDGRNLERDCRSVQEFGETFINNDFLLGKDSITYFISETTTNTGDMYLPPPASSYTPSIKLIGNVSHTCVVKKSKLKVFAQFNSKIVESEVGDDSTQSRISNVLLEKVKIAGSSLDEVEAKDSEIKNSNIIRTKIENSRLNQINGSSYSIIRDSVLKDADVDNSLLQSVAVVNSKLVRTNVGYNNYNDVKELITIKDSQMTDSQIESKDNREVSLTNVSLINTGIRTENNLTVLNFSKAYSCIPRSETTQACNSPAICIQGLFCYPRN